MRRFALSPFNRALLLMLVGNALVLVWLGPDMRRAAAARAQESPTWAVVLLIVSLGLLAYGALEAYLIHVLREPPPRDR